MKTFKCYCFKHKSGTTADNSAVFIMALHALMQWDQPGNARGHIVMEECIDDRAYKKRGFDNSEIVRYFFS